MQPKGEREIHGLEGIPEVCVAVCEPFGRAATAHSRAGAFGRHQPQHPAAEQARSFCCIATRHSSPPLPYSQHCPSPHELKEITIFTPGFH